MSLEVDGIWKAGVWATTVWGDGVWREGLPSESGGGMFGGLSHFYNWFYMGQ